MLSMRERQCELSAFVGADALGSMCEEVGQFVTLAPSPQICPTMKNLGLVLIASALAVAPRQLPAPNPERARLEREAQNVTDRKSVV